MVNAGTMVNQTNYSKRKNLVALIPKPYLRFTMKNRSSIPKSRMESRRGTQKACLLALKLAELLFSIHLNNKRNHQNQKGSTCNPCSLASAPEYFLAETTSI